MKSIRPIPYKKYKSLARKYRTKERFPNLEFQKYVAKFNDAIEFNDCVTINNIIEKANAINDKELRRLHFINEAFRNLEGDIMTGRKFLYYGARYKTEQNSVRSPMYYILKKHFI